MFQKTAAAQI
jgi:hypothetical protein